MCGNNDTLSNTLHTTTQSYLWKHADKMDVCVCVYIYVCVCIAHVSLKQRELTVLVGVRTVHHDVRLRGRCCSSLRHKRANCFFLRGGKRDFAFMNTSWQKESLSHTSSWNKWNFNMLLYSFSSCYYHYEPTVMLVYHYLILLLLLCLEVESYWICSLKSCT